MTDLEHHALARLDADTPAPITPAGIVRDNTDNGLAAASFNRGPEPLV
jgi:hypothetical protein